MKIQEWPLTHTVHEGLMQLVHQGRALPEAKLKKFETDVEQIKKLLNERIGNTWEIASTKNQHSKLGLTTRKNKKSLPWETMARSMTHGSGGGEEHMYDWASRTIKRLAP